MVVVLACGLLLVCSVGVLLLRSRDTGPIPRNYSHGLDFQLYYPARLPSGYVVDPASFKREDSVLIFSIKAPRGRTIAISEQAIPTRASHPTQSGPAPIAGERSFQSNIGNVHISLWGDKYVSDVITDETWIILNVTGFTTDEATAVTQSFRKL